MTAPTDRWFTGVPANTWIRNREGLLAVQHFPGHVLYHWVKPDGTQGFYCVACAFAPTQPAYAGADWEPDEGRWHGFDPNGSGVTYGSFREGLACVLMHVFTEELPEGSALDAAVARFDATAETILANTGVRHGDTAAAVRVYLAHRTR